MRKRSMTFDEIVSYWKTHRTEIYYVENYDVDGSDIKTIGMIVGIDILEKYICFAPNNWYTANDINLYVTRENGSKFEIEE